MGGLGETGLVEGNRNRLVPRGGIWGQGMAGKAGCGKAGPEVTGGMEGNKAGFQGRGGVGNGTGRGSPGLIG